MTAASAPTHSIRTAPAVRTTRRPGLIRSFIPAAPLFHAWRP